MKEPEQLALFDLTENEDLGWTEGLHDYVHEEDE